MKKQPQTSPGKCPKCNVPLQSHLHRYHAPGCPPLPIVREMKFHLMGMVAAFSGQQKPVFIGWLGNWVDPEKK